MSTITVPSRERIANSPAEAAQALIDVAQAAKTDIDALGGPIYARGVVDSNVANLAAFTVANNDGITYVEGDTVLLALQTTAAQCGLYVVGTVGGGTAPLTRHPAMAATDVIIPGTVIEVGGEGTAYGGSSWKAMIASATGVYGTNDPLFYPKSVKGTVTLATGTKALGATQKLWLYSTTKSGVAVSCNTPNTVTASVGLSAPVASRTAGKVGTAALTINAFKTDATTDTNNISTVDYTITNW